MVLVIALIGCRNYSPEVEGTTEMEARICIPAEQSWESPTTGMPSGRRLGASVAILSIGSGPDGVGSGGTLERTNRNAYRLIAAGAPGLNDDGALGFVEVFEASVSNGELQGSSASMNSTLQMPAATGYSGWQFGYTLEAADVANCGTGLIWAVEPTMSGAVRSCS